MQAVHGLVTAILSGIVLIALAYVLLNNASGVKTIGSAAGHETGRVVDVFAGGS